MSSIAQERGSKFPVFDDVLPETNGGGDQWNSLENRVEGFLPPHQSRPVSFECHWIVEFMNRKPILLIHNSEKPRKIDY